MSSCFGKVVVVRRNTQVSHVIMLWLSGGGKKKPQDEGMKG
jgi:hypothetical protein